MFYIFVTNKSKKYLNRVKITDNNNFKISNSITSQIFVIINKLLHIKLYKRI